MAEVIGVVGAALAIAEQGLKLSQSIYDYVEKVRVADKDVQNIANDVRSTAIVLKELGANLERDEASAICSKEFFQAFDKNIKDCSKAFGNIEDMLQKSIKTFQETPLSDESTKKVSNLSTGEKFKWPFKRTKIGMLRNDLDRQKADLQMKLHVFMLAFVIDERRKTNK